MHPFINSSNELPALERNILKYRSLEIVLILFHIEELKLETLSSVRASDSLMNRLQGTDIRLPDGTKKLFKKLWNTLVCDGVLTKDEKSEIEGLIDYRNIVAHKIQNIVFDLSNFKDKDYYINKDYMTYNYEALDRIRHYRNLIDKRRRGNVKTINFSSLYFESLEKAIVSELKKLKLRIDNLYKERKVAIDQINNEINQSLEILDEIHPRDPSNKLNNGSLSKTGVKCCYELFDHGLSSPTVSYLMNISLKSIKKRKKSWAKA